MYTCYYELSQTCKVVEPHISIICSSTLNTVITNHLIWWNNVLLKKKNYCSVLAIISGSGSACTNYSNALVVIKLQQ